MRRASPVEPVLEAADGKTVGAVVVVRGIDVGRIEVQVVAVGRVGSTGPEVAVRASIKESAGGVVAVAGSALITDDSWSRFEKQRQAFTVKEIPCHWQGGY